MFFCVMCVCACVCVCVCACVLPELEQQPSRLNTDQVLQDKDKHLAWSLHFTFGEGDSYFQVAKRA